MAKLNAKALGLAGGTLWAACLAVWTLIATWTGYGSEILQLLTTIYPGYAISYVGVLLGAVYGFIDAFIGCWLLALLYNKFQKK